MKQKPRDRDEVIFLLSYCLKIEAGDVPRKEAVEMIKTRYKFMGYLELPSLGNRRNRREEARKGIAAEYAPNAQSA